MARKKTARPAPKARRPPEKTLEDLADAAFGKHWAALREARERERELFRAAVKSLRTATPLERARVCRYWASRLDEWGDHEAVAYLMDQL